MSFVSDNSSLKELKLNFLLFEIGIFILKVMIIGILRKSLCTEVELNLLNVVVHCISVMINFDRKFVEYDVTFHSLFGSPLGIE